MTRLGIFFVLAALTALAFAGTVVDVLARDVLDPMLGWVTTNAAWFAVVGTLVVFVFLAFGDALVDAVLDRTSRRELPRPPTAPVRSRQLPSGSPGHARSLTRPRARPPLAGGTRRGHPSHMWIDQELGEQ